MMVPASTSYFAWSDEPVRTPARYLVEGPATYGPDRPTHDDLAEMERFRAGDEYKLCRWARQTLLGVRASDYQTARAREAAVRVEAADAMRSVIIQGRRKLEKAPRTPGVPTAA